MSDTLNLHGCYTLFFSTILTLLPFIIIAFDTITPTQPLLLNQTIVSEGEVFELGFFSLSHSNKWFVGIWYKNILPKTIVWVANRDSPIADSTGALKIGEDGNIVVVSQFQKPIWWSSNQTADKKTVAQLLDSGNFVLRRENDVDPENYLWQSFDHPTDTLLPGMKLGWDAKTGMNKALTSWRTNDDPSSGDYSFKFDLNGFPEIFLWDKQVRDYRSGPWNGLRFSGVPEMKPTYVLIFSFVMDPNEITYSFDLKNKSLYSRLIVNASGALQRLTWIETTQVWNLFWFAPKDQCDDYRECGDYGVCDNNASPVCKCMQGFEPKNPEAWYLRDGSGGCVRTTKLNCRDDGFLALKNMKLPETTTAFVDKRMGLVECEKACRSNCSCTAYANMDVTGGGSGCVIWTAELVDMRQYAVAEGGQDLFVRVAAGDLARISGSPNGSRKPRHTVEVVSISVAIGVVLLGLSVCFVWKRKRMQKTLRENISHRGPLERSQDFLLTEGIVVSRREYSGETTAGELELPLFEFAAIAAATDNFSDKNKLGEGGFGCVYKAVLEEGQESAVKRLAKASGQGTEEFKTEVRLIARLQHRNLVRLLGCCIDKDEKILVYEYMENKSLDTILFS